MEENLNTVFDELTKILVNLKKDGSRPKTQKLINEKLETINNLKIQYDDILLQLLESSNEDQVKIFSDHRDNTYKIIDQAIEKLKNSPVLTTQVIGNAGLETNKTTMAGESFDLKTASAVLQEFSGDPATCKDFLDTVEMYDSLLNTAGKKILLDFVLKVKIKGAAKIKLSCAKPPTSITELKELILERFAPRKSLKGLTNQLKTTKQNGKSVNEFAKQIEYLTQQITELQVTEENKEQKHVIAEVNEQHALIAFTSGVKPHIQQVVLASNPKTLNEAIEIALETEATTADQRQDPREFSINYIHRNPWRNRDQQQKRAFQSHQRFEAFRGRKSYNNQNFYRNNKNNYRYNYTNQNSKEINRNSNKNQNRNYKSNNHFNNRARVRNIRSGNQEVGNAISPQPHHQGLREEDH